MLALSNPLQFLIVGKEKFKKKKIRKENIDRTINEKKKKIKLWQYVTG